MDERIIQRLEEQLRDAHAANVDLRELIEEAEKSRDDQPRPKLLLPRAATARRAYGAFVPLAGGSPIRPLLSR
jgi:small ligand-binding sensory domain FIST